MALGSVEVVVPGQRHEAVDRQRRLLRCQLDRDVAEVRHDLGRVGLGDVDAERRVFRELLLRGLGTVGGRTLARVGHRWGGDGNWNRDGNDLDHERDRIARSDQVAGAGVAVRQAGRDVDLTASAETSADQALGKARDDARGAERDRDRLTAVVAVVELDAVGASHADVVHLDGVADADRVARTVDHIGDDQFGRHLGRQRHRRLAGRRVVGCGDGGPSHRVGAVVGLRCRIGRGVALCNCGRGSGCRLFVRPSAAGENEGGNDHAGARAGREPAPTHCPAPGVTETTSTTNVNASPGRIVPRSASPYARSAGMSSWRRAPAFTPSNPCSQPAITPPEPSTTGNGTAAVVVVVELDAVLGAHPDIVHDHGVAVDGALAGALDKVGHDQFGHRFGRNHDLGLGRRRRRVDRRRCRSEA